MRPVLSALLFVVVELLPSSLLSQTPSASEPPTSPAQEPARLFDYDAAQPIDAREAVTDERNGVAIIELTYASPREGRVTATLVTPARPGRCPALLFGHWGYGDRREFLPEAEQWARAGVACLLPDYPWDRPAPWRRSPARGVADPETDVAVLAQAVVDLRRGLDLLAARPDVDPNHIAYIGHSWGAQWGAILSAVDDRVRAAVLVAGVGCTADVYEHDDPDMLAFRTATPPEQLKHYLETVGVLDAIRWVPKATPTPLLFQFALHDRGNSVRSMERYAAAASDPKRVLWYFTGHELNDPRALQDRVDWLHQVAGFPSWMAPMQHPAVNPRLLALSTLREAELAFARTNRERGQRAAWLAWFAPDGVMFQPGPVKAHEAMHEETSGAPPAAFDWRPVYGDVASSGDLGYSTGPVHIPSSGPTRNWFFSIWRRQPDGEWRVAVDLGVPVGALQHDPFDDPYQPARATDSRGIPGTAEELIQLDRTSRASFAALAELFDPDVRGLRSDQPLIVGQKAFTKVLGNRPGRLTHEPSGGGVSAAGDLGYTYGRYVIEGAAGEAGAYVRAWRRDRKGDWRIVFDVFRRDARTE